MKKIILGILIMATMAGAFYAMRLDVMAWYLWHTYVDSTQTSVFGLGTYEVAIEAREIPDLSDASGLTYHAPSGTLFSVLNKEPTIIQLSAQGELLRKIRVEGVSDMEGITHVSDNQFLVVEESKNRLILIEIGNQDSINVEDRPKFSLRLENVRNKSFEGISWDARNERILVVNEKVPKRLVEIRGLVKSPDGKSPDIAIRDLWQEKPGYMHGLRDLASLSYAEESGHLLLLSEESRLVKELDSKGETLSAMLLWKGFHGLKQTVPQAEGIAIGPNREIYIMSEPNLFYVFSPARRDAGD